MSTCKTCKILNPECGFYPGKKHCKNCSRKRQLELYYNKKKEFEQPKEHQLNDVISLEFKKLREELTEKQMQNEKLSSSLAELRGFVVCYYQFYQLAEVKLRSYEAKIRDLEFSVATAIPKVSHDSNAFGCSQNLVDSRAIHHCS